MLHNALRAGYRLVFNTVFRRMDAERAHHIGASVIRAIGQNRIVASAIGRLTAPAPELRVRTLGLEFPSPFGVAAGFDKNAQLVDGLAALGFGHVEVGTVTPVAQPGNPKPRMYRLPKDRGLINRMGFNNDGAHAALEALQQVRSADCIVGVNIGKNKSTPAEEAVNDYVRAATMLRSAADYLVVNVSSPNTPGLRGLQELDALAPILEATCKAASGVPVLVKIAPDLTDEQIQRICQLAVRIGLDGIVATNTTISREGLDTPGRIVDAYGQGGLSGAPLRERSLEVLRTVRASVPQEFCVISVGGVTTAADVQARLDAGATLVQGYTAFLYEGPAWASAINRELARMRSGASSH